jgi:hypothetical protein
MREARSRRRTGSNGRPWVVLLGRPLTKWARARPRHRVSSPRTLRRRDRQSRFAVGRRLPSATEPTGPI